MSTSESNSQSINSKESEKKSVTTSHSFKTRGYSQKWKEKDTRLFFKALSVFGTDFSMVSLLFKGRNRNQIINKFHKEEKDNMKKVENALRIHKQGNSRVLKRCNHLLSQPIPHSEGFECKRIRGGSGTSLDSLDEMIFEEIDDQIHRSLKTRTEGSIALFASTLEAHAIPRSNPFVHDS